MGQEEFVNYHKSILKLLVEEFIFLASNRREGSSTNKFGFDARLSDKSSIFIKNSNRLRIGSWGIPSSTFVHGDFWSFKTLLYILVFRKSVMILKRLPDIWFWFNLMRSPSSQTLSNAFESLLHNLNQMTNVGHGWHTLVH